MGVSGVVGDVGFCYGGPGCWRGGWRVVTVVVVANFGDEREGVVGGESAVPV